MMERLPPFSLPLKKRRQRKRTESAFSPLKVLMGSHASFAKEEENGRMPKEQASMGRGKREFTRNGSFVYFPEPKKKNPSKNIGKNLPGG